MHRANTLRTSYGRVIRNSKYDTRPRSKPKPAGLGPTEITVSGPANMPLEACKAEWDRGRYFTKAGRNGGINVAVAMVQFPFTDIYLLHGGERHLVLKGLERPTTI